MNQGVDSKIHKFNWLVVVIGKHGTQPLYPMSSQLKNEMHITVGYQLVKR